MLIDDGRIELRVVSASGDEVRCEVVRGGELGGRKGVHVLGARLSLGSLGDTDVADLKFAVEQDIDYVAASFVRSAENVKEIRELLQSHGGLRCRSSPRSRTRRAWRTSTRSSAWRTAS